MGQRKCTKNTFNRCRTGGNTKEKSSRTYNEGITEQAYERAKKEGTSYEDALKKIKQELADKETPLDIPGIEFKDKDELAMGGIASLMK